MSRNATTPRTIARIGNQRLKGLLVSNRLKGLLVSNNIFIMFDFYLERFGIFNTDNYNKRKRKRTECTISHINMYKPIIPAAIAQPDTGGGAVNGFVSSGIVSPKEVFATCFVITDGASAIGDTAVDGFCEGGGAKP